MIASCNRDVSTYFHSGFHPQNVEGSMFRTIVNSRGGDREHIVSNMFGQIEQILAGDEKLSQAAD